MKIIGKLTIEAHGNDYYFEWPTIDGENLTEFIKDYEGKIIIITVEEWR